MPLPTKTISICVAVAWLLVSSPSSGADDEAPADGKAVGGLRIRLQLPAAGKGEKLPPQCEVTLENVGDSDLNVKLGFSLANGKSHHPDALRLLVRSKGNKTRTLIYAAIPGVAGRVDPFVLPLPAGSSYTLRCAFDKYADSETGDRLDLTAKDYRIVAELLGEAITETNLDVQGLALIPCWQGKARSNEVRLPLAAEPGAKTGARRGRMRNDGGWVAPHTFLYVIVFPSLVASSSVEVTFTLCFVVVPLRVHSSSSPPFTL
jgi:hypothetical protein